MSNKKKDGDFNLDEELRAQIVANEEGQPLSDEHEDGFEYEVNEFEEEEKKYRINPRLKRRDELRKSDILLSVRNLKQFFFFGGKIHRQKLKAVSNVSFDVHKGVMMHDIQPMNFLALKAICMSMTSWHK